MHLRMMGRLLGAGVVMVALGLLGAADVTAVNSDAAPLASTSVTDHAPMTTAASMTALALSSAVPAPQTGPVDGAALPQASRVLPLPPAASIFPMMMFVVLLTMRKYRRGF